MALTIYGMSRLPQQVKNDPIFVPVNWSNTAKRATHIQNSFVRMRITNALKYAALAGLEIGFVAYKFTASIILSGSLAFVAAAVAIYCVGKLFKKLQEGHTEFQLLKINDQNDFDAYVTKHDGCVDNRGNRPRYPALLAACSKGFPQSFMNYYLAIKPESWKTHKQELLALVMNQPWVSGQDEANRLQIVKTIVEKLEKEGNSALKVTPNVDNFTAFELALQKRYMSIVSYLCTVAQPFRAETLALVCTDLIANKQILKRCFEFKGPTVFEDGHEEGPFLNAIRDYLSPATPTPTALTPPPRAVSVLSRDSAGSVDNDLSSPINLRDVDAFGITTPHREIIFFANLINAIRSPGKEEIMQNFILQFRHDPVFQDAFVIDRNNAHNDNPAKYLPKLFLDQLAQLKK